MSRDVSAHSDRVYMAELEEMLGRKRATIRKWERDGLWKNRRDLMPHRDGQDWRYWTIDQVVLIAEWIRDEDLYPGKGFGGEEQAKRHREEAEKRIEHVKKIAAERAA